MKKNTEEKKTQKEKRKKKIKERPFGHPWITQKSYAPCYMIYFRQRLYLSQILLLGVRINCPTFANWVESTWRRPTLMQDQDMMNMRNAWLIEELFSLEMISYVPTRSRYRAAASTHIQTHGSMYPQLCPSTSPTTSVHADCQKWMQKGTAPKLQWQNHSQKQ